MTTLMMNKDLMLRYSHVVRNHMETERDALDRCIQLMKTHDAMLMSGDIQAAYDVLMHATEKYLILCKGRAIVDELNPQIVKAIEKASKARDELNETKKKYEHGAGGA